MLTRLLLHLLLNALSKAFCWGLKPALLRGATTTAHDCCTKLISHKSERERTKTFLEIHSKRERDRNNEGGMSEQRDLPVFFRLMMRRPIVLAALATLLVYRRR